MVSGGLLEREPELSRLRELVAAVVRAAGGLRIVEGEAGAGKTALLLAAAYDAREAGCEVLPARAGVFELTLGYGVARQLFEAHAGRTPLSAAILGPAAPPEPGSPEREFAAQHELYRLAASLAEHRPLLIAIDDAQWCDLATLRWLLYLTRRLGGLAVGIVLAVRIGEGGAVGELLSALSAEPVTEVIRPSPLSVPATATLLESVYGRAVDHEFAIACHEWTSGNPFLVTELATDLLGGSVEPTASAVARMRELSPEAVRHNAVLGLAQLGPDAVAVAQALSVLGTASELRHVAALAGIDPSDARPAADALIAARILEPQTQLCFAHPLIASVVYESVAPARRAADHARAARLLAADGASAERLCVHLLRSEPAAEDWVVAQLRAAAADQRARGATDAAVPLLRRALEEPPPVSERAQTLHDLGAAEDLTGHAEAAADHLGEALALASSAGQRAPIALELGMALTRQARVDDACQVLRRELDHGADGVSAELTLAMQVHLHLAAQFTSRRHAEHERLEQIAPSLSATTPEGRAGLAALAVRRLHKSESAVRAIEPAAEVLAAGVPDDAGREAAVMGSAVAVLVHCGVLDEPEAWIARSLRRSLEAGALFGVAQARYLQGLACRGRGRLAEAATNAELAIDGVIGEYGTMWTNALGAALLVDALVERGELDAAGRHLARRGLIGDLPEGAMLGVLLESRGRWRWRQGDLAGALRDLTEAGERHNALGATSPAFTTWRSSCALVQLQLGRRSAAAELAGEELELARRVGLPRPTGVALHATGLIEGGERGIALLNDAVSSLDSSPARLERARALVDLGAALRRARRRAEARRPLREGLELAHRCGAPTLAERAREELRATGARPCGALRTGVEALTPSELRVCRMAAEGMSNPEIAQGLFITRGTVESHLHSAYTKLAIRSRAELADAFSRATDA